MKRSQIIAHRGLHNQTSISKNSTSSILKAIESGFGLETDIRDFGGDIYISHDPITETCMSLEEFLILIENIDPKSYGKIAMNVKADGLAQRVKEIINNTIEKNRLDMFFFDASVPDMLSYHKEGFTIYSRKSELEDVASMNGLYAGIWIDSFDGSYDQLSEAIDLCSKGIACAIVSPELHGRPHLGLWKGIKKCSIDKCRIFNICTDYPEEAFEFFNN